MENKGQASAPAGLTYRPDKILRYFSASIGQYNEYARAAWSNCWGWSMIDWILSGIQSVKTDVDLRL